MESLRPDQVLKTIAKGLLGKVFAYGAFVLGFWLLYQGFARPNIGLGVLGGLAIPVAAYLMVLARKSDPVTGTAPKEIEQEDRSGDSIPSDSIDGSGPGDKLPP
jgi:hypothetical protein